jgi:hypothetical protein
MAYELRFFFDAGSGTCLWAANDAARQRFGYPVNLWEMPISESSKKWLQHLVCWFDTSLDWEAPGDAQDRWTEDELQRFRQAVQQGLSMLREELPPSQFEVRDETAA